MGKDHAQTEAEICLQCAVLTAPVDGAPQRTILKLGDFE